MWPLQSLFIRKTDWKGMENDKNFHERTAPDYVLSTHLTWPDNSQEGKL